MFTFEAAFPVPCPIFLQMGLAKLVHRPKNIQRIKLWQWFHNTGNEFSICEYIFLLLDDFHGFMFTYFFYKLTHMRFI